jgi:hypothetical protein
LVWNFAEYCGQEWAAKLEQHVSHQEGVMRQLHLDMSSKDEAIQVLAHTNAQLADQHQVLMTDYAGRYALFCRFPASFSHFFSHRFMCKDGHI